MRSTQRQSNSDKKEPKEKKESKKTKRSEIESNPQPGTKRARVEEQSPSAAHTPAQQPLLEKKQKTDLQILARHIKDSQSLRAEMLHPEIEAQEKLFFPRILGIDSAVLTGSSGITIDASVGSSGFFPPNKIFEAIKTFKREDVVEYGFKKEIAAAEMNLAKYLAEEGAIEPGTLIEFTETGQIPNPQTQYAVLGCGSQHIITELVSAIIKTGDVIVVPTPTYGLLLKIIKAAGGEYVCFPLKEENGYKPNPDELLELITTINHDLKERHKEEVKLIIAKIEKYIPRCSSSRKVYSLIIDLERNLNSSASLSTSIIRKLNQAVSVYVADHIQSKDYKLKNPLQQKVFKLKLIEKLKVPFRNCVRGYLHIDPHNPTGSVMTQPEIDALSEALKTVPKLTIIDDKAHDHIFLDDVEIGHLSRTPARDKTVTIDSFSKSYALAGMRTGMAFGPHKLINKVASRMYDAQVFPPISVIATVNAVTSTPKEKRHSYFTKCSNIYRARLALVKACLYGISSIPSQAIRENILGKIAEQGFSDELVSTGISNLSLLSDPQGCFFVTFDFSQYKGFYLGETQLKDGIDFANLLYYLADVQTVPHELNGYFDKPAVRFALTLADYEIYQAMEQIAHALAYLTPAPNPRFHYTSLPQLGTQTETRLDK